MNVQILENAQAIGAAVGQLFVEQVKTQPDSVLGLATGSSPDSDLSVYGAGICSRACFFSKCYHL